MGPARLRAEDPVSIGDFKILGRLGAGGFGTVYLGLTPGGRKVAVKTVHRHVADSEGFRARFRREVEALRRAGGFFTAPLVDADPTAELPWLATEYVPGPDLATVVTRGGPLAPEALWRLGAGLCEALATLHGAGLVHRDLKPSNVLLVPDGPRVIDFGIASLADATRLTVTHEAAGTPGYVAPEQLRGMRGVGPAADVFALTCLLLYAGTGRTPFRSRTFVEYIAHVLHEPPDLTGVHGPLAELAHGGLALDPGERLDLPALAALCARHARVDDVHGFADLLVPAARDLLTHASAEAATERAYGVPATKPQTDGAELPERPHTRAADARPWVWTAPGLGEGEYVAFQGPALDRDAGIVCLAGGGTIHGFDAATGAQRWSVQAGFELRAGPVPAHGVFVFADDQGRAYGHRARDGVRLWERDPDGEAGRPVTDIRLLVTDTPEQLVVLRVGRRAGEPESDYTWDDIALLRPDTGMAVTTKPRHGDSSPRRDDANWVVGDRLFIAGYERLASVGFGADEGSSWTEKAHAAVSIGERTYTWRSFGGLVCRDGATGTALWRSRKPRGPSLSALVGTPDGETVLVVTGRGIWAHAARTGRLRWTTPVADVGRRPRVDRAGVTAGVVWSAFGSVLLGHDLADGRPLWRLTSEEPYLTMAVEPHGGLLHVHDGRRLRGIRPADGGDAWSVASHEHSALGDFLPHWTAGDLLYVREESGVRAYDVLRDA